MKETQAYTQTEPMPSFCKGDNADEEMNKALRRCRASFFRNAYRFLNNEADAEDAVQDALLSAYKHIDQFRGEAQMSTWLTAIVSNSARMQLRKRQRQIHVSLDEPIGEEQEQTRVRLIDGRAAKSRGQVSRIRITCARERVCDATLAYVTQDIRVACLRWSDH